MSGKLGIATLKGAISGVFGIAGFGIQTVKNLATIKQEIADLQGDEIVEIATQIVIVEIPKIVSVFKPTTTTLK